MALGDEWGPEGELGPEGHNKGDERHRRFKSASQRHPRCHSQPPALPGRAANIGRIVAIADSEQRSIQELLDVLLADVHLTQRIRATPNSVGYRLHSGSGVSHHIQRKKRQSSSAASNSLGDSRSVRLRPDPGHERAAAMKGELILALQASLWHGNVSATAPEDRIKPASPRSSKRRCCAGPD